MTTGVPPNYQGEMKEPEDVKFAEKSAPSNIILQLRKAPEKVALGFWIVCILMAVVVWHFFARDCESKDGAKITCFSFLLTFAALWRCFGMLMMNYKVWISESVKGISMKTMELYAIVFLFRMMSIIRHQGYLPFDKSGDWLYHVIEFYSLTSTVLVLYGMFVPYKSTYDSKYDKFGNLHVPAQYGIVYLVVPCFILACLFHPGLNKEFFSDTCWAFSMYLEAVAMVPQLYMLHKQAGDASGVVEVILGHITFALGFSRVFELIFWSGSFQELHNHSGKMPGYLVLLSQVGQLLIMGDFFYYYLVSVSKGVPIELPTSYSTAV